MSETSQPAKSSSDNTKLFSILAYLGILWLVGLLAAKDNKAVMFHVNQGIILTIVNVIGTVVFAIPFLGWIAGPIVSIFVIVAMVMGIINAVNSKQEPLPIVGKMFTFVK